MLGPQGSLVDPLGFGSLRLRFKSGWSHFVSTRLSSIWQSVGLQIQMLLVQVRQSGLLLLFLIYFNSIDFLLNFNILKCDQCKHLYIIINILFYEYNLLAQFALVVQGLSCGPVEPATRVQIPARALNYKLSKIATLYSFV